MRGARRLVLPAIAFVTGAGATAAAQATSHRGTWFPAAGLHVGVPERVSAGIGIGRVAPLGQPEALYFASVEPGLGATRLSVGYVTFFGATKAGLTTTAFRPTVLRTNRWPAGAARPLATYAGLEVQWHPLILFGIRGGVMWPTSRDTRGSGPVATFGLSALM